MEDTTHFNATFDATVDATLMNHSLATLTIILLVNCVLNAICSFTAALGNTVVLLSIWNTPALHSPSNTLLFSLALSDFLVGLVSQPLYVASRLFYVITQKEGPLALRDAFDVTSSMLSGASFMTATLISIDRYLVLMLHMRYRTLVTTQRLWLLIAGAWLLSSLWGFMWMYSSQVFYLSGIISSAACFYVTSLMYFKIYRVLRRHQAQILVHNRIGAGKRSIQLNFSRYTRSVVNSFYVCFLFFLCYFPYLCTAAIIQLTGHSISKKAVLEFAGSVAFIKSSLNPLVYFWRVREIRIAIKNTLRRVNCN